MKEASLLWKRAAAVSLVAVLYLSTGCLDYIFGKEEEVVLKPGDFAPDYLQYKKWKRLKLEWDSFDTFQPDRSVGGPVAVFKERIATYLDKDPEIIEDIGKPRASTQDVYTDEDIARIMSDLRTNYKVLDIIPIYILYLNGRYSDGHGGGENIFGKAVGPDAIVIFKERIVRYVQNQSEDKPYIFTTKEIETAVLLHEFGHLLALVNINYVSDKPHEDLDHPHHTINQKDVMYWSVERTDLYDTLRSAPPNDFQEECKSDIEGIRSGYYCFNPGGCEPYNRTEATKDLYNG